MCGLQAARGAPLSSAAAAGPDQPPDKPGGPPAGPATAGRRRRSLLPAVLGVAVFVLAADIVSKVIVVATLSDRRCLSGGPAPVPPPIRLLGGFVTLCESRNPGAAFGIGGTSTTIVFTAIAVGVIAFIIRTSRQIHSLPWAIALGLLLGGATGNLTDRIFRAPAPFRGWVVDWIQLPHWPVFNLADSAITCGAVLMVLLAAFGRRLDGMVHPAPPQQPAPSAPASDPGEPRPQETRPQQPSGSGGG